MTVPGFLVEPVQRAAGYVAARAHGDLDGAELLLSSFDSDGERLLAFAVLAQLAVGLLAEHEGADVADTASRLATRIAGAALP